MRRFLLGIAAFFCFSGSASAYFLSGDDLYQLMNGNAEEQSQALGYVIGLADAESNHLLFNGAVGVTNGTWKDKNLYLFSCIPNGVTAGRLTDVVRSYLSEKPERRHENAVVLVRAALVGTWPCPANN